MLYVTTRDSNNPQTAYKTLHNDFSLDGGCYVPFRMDPFTEEYIASLKDKSFGQAIADVLNYFFSLQLSGWDVEFCIGRNNLKVVSLNSKIVIAGTWHNPGSSYRYIVESLYSCVCKDVPADREPTEWSKIAIRIAVLFGITGEIMRQGHLSNVQLFDIAVSADDLSEVTAAWYAKLLGLPIGAIICGCSDSRIWDLLHRGILNAGHMSDGMALSVERLLYCVLGSDEANRFCQNLRAHSAYAPAETLVDQLRSAFFACMISTPRATTLINSVYRTNAAIVDPKTAIAYGAVQDFRAKTGANNLTLLLADETPMNSLEEIQIATGISKQTLAGLCDNH